MIYYLENLFFKRLAKLFLQYFQIVQAELFFIYSFEL